MTSSLNNQTSREIRYAKREQKKMIERHNVERTARVERRTVNADISLEVSNEISRVVHKKRIVPPRKASLRQSVTSFYL
jgi:hypothetical protein